jgi:hypothetical protein
MIDGIWRRGRRHRGAMICILNVTCVIEAASSIMLAAAYAACGGGLYVVNGVLNSNWRRHARGVIRNGSSML